MSPLLNRLCVVCHLTLSCLLSSLRLSSWYKLSPQVLGILLQNTNCHRRHLAAFLLDSGFFSSFSTHDQPRGENKQRNINMKVVIFLFIVFIMLTSLLQAWFWRLGELGVQVERCCLGGKSSGSQVCSLSTIWCFWYSY